MKPFLSVFHAKAHDFKCEVGELCYVIIKTEHLQMNVKTFSALLLLFCYSYASSEKISARDCYLQVLSGAENLNFLSKLSADDYDSDISDEEL